MWRRIFKSKREVPKIVRKVGIKKMKVIDDRLIVALGNYGPRDEEILGFGIFEVLPEPATEKKVFGLIKAVKDRKCLGRKVNLPKVDVIRRGEVKLLEIKSREGFKEGKMYEFILVFTTGPNIIERFQIKRGEEQTRIIPLQRLNGSLAR